MKIKAAIYIQLPVTCIEATTFFSEVTQICSFANSNDMEIIKVYSESPKLIKRGSRPQMKYALNDLACGSIQKIIFCDKSWASISNTPIKNLLATESCFNLKQLDALKAEVNQELAIYVHHYNSQLAIKRLQGIASQCKHTGGLPPFGYKVNDKKKLIIDKDEEKIVRLIYKLFLNGSDLPNILHYLNKDGLKKRSGKHFTKNDIFKILSNEKYTGCYILNLKKSEVNKVIRVEGGIPAIVSKIAFEAVQNTLYTSK